MNFYLTGSSDGFNALRFPNVEDWQNCMGHTEGISNGGILHVWNMYMEKK